MEKEDAAAAAWSEEAVGILIDTYTAKFMALQRSNLRQKDWQEILARLASSCGEGYNYARCRNKLDSLKKKFKNVRSKRSVKGAIVKWKWYDQMEKLMDGGVARGIPGGIASGEKLGQSAATDEDCAANSGEEEDDDEEDEEEEEEEEEEDKEVMPGSTSSNFLFDLRQGGSGFLESGLNLTLNGICQAAAAAAAATGGSSGRSPSLARVSSRAIVKKKSSSQGLSREAVEVMAVMIQGLERIEKSRLEFEERKLEMMREIDLKRNETNLEIAKCIIDSCITKSFPF